MNLAFSILLTVYFTTPDFQPNVTCIDLLLPIYLFIGVCIYLCCFYILFIEKFIKR